MRNLLYIITGVFIVLWAVAFLGYGSGAIMHMLLVVALIVLLVQVVWEDKTVRDV